MALKHLMSLWKPSPGKQTATMASAKAQYDLMIPKGTRVLLFANTERRGDKSPDYVLKLEYDDGRDAQQHKSQPQARADDLFDDDTIPF